MGKNKGMVSKPIYISDVKNLMEKMGVTGKHFVTWSQLNGDFFIRSSKYPTIVKECKKLVSGGNVNRLAIASIALKICKIKRGGDMVSTNSEERNKNTVERFAKDIGVHPRVLHHWVYITKHVVNNLGKDIDFVRWSSASRTLQSIGPNAEPKKYINEYNRLEKDNGIARKMLAGIAAIKTLRNQLKEHGATKLKKNERKVLADIAIEIHRMAK